MKSKHDIRGKSIGEVLALAETQMRELVEDKLIEYESMLRCHGATPTELSAELARAKADMEASVGETMVKLRAWLHRDGNIIN